MPSKVNPTDTDHWIHTRDLKVASAHPDRVASLNLSHRKDMELPLVLAQMVHLTHLDLSWTFFNDLDQLFAILSSLPKLQNLILGLRKGQVIPDGIGGLQALEELHIEAGSLEELPAAMAQLSQLKSLKLYVATFLGNGDHLQPLGRLPRLDSLELSTEGDWPNGMAHLDKLRSLETGTLKAAPTWLRGLHGLQSLNITFWDLDDQPFPLEGFAGLKQLQSLAIHTTGPCKFKESLSGLTALTHVSLKQNELTTLPEWLLDLPALSHLDLTNNHLAQLPDWIGELKTLKTLQLRWNRLKQLPSTLARAAALELIHLDENQFVEFPSVLASVPNLKEVDLGKNKISKLPEMDWSSSKVESINLRMNKLAEFPWPLAAARLAKIELEGNPVVKAAGYKMDRVIAGISAGAHSPATRMTLLALAVGDPVRAAQSATIEALITGLNDADAKVRALSMEAMAQFLPDPFAAETAPTAVVICGVSKSPAVADLKKKLEAKQIKVTKVSPTASVIVVVAEKPGEEAAPYLAAGAKPATIGQLIAFLDQVDQPWLRKKAEAEPKVGENLRALLASGTVDNLKLALQMIEAGGLPTGLLSEMLALSLIHPDKTIKKAAAMVVEAHASPALKAFIAANSRNVSAMEFSKMIEHLKRFMSQEGIEPAHFAKMASHCGSDLYHLYVPFMSGPELLEKVIVKGKLELKPYWSEAVPKGVMELESLATLEFDHLKLKNLPADIERIPGLKRLSMVWNKISTLPDSFAQLTDLEELDLRNNSFKQVPPVISRLSKLKNLSLDENLIGKLSPDFGNLVHLRELNLKDCGFSKFPEQILALEALENLDLSKWACSASIKVIPAEIGRLKRLRVLNLFHQAYMTLPKEFGELPLEVLDVGRGEFERLPASILDCINLKELEMMGCFQLTTLPEDLGRLVNLERLMVGNTPLTALPSSIVQLQRLKYLDLTALDFADRAGTIELLTQLPALVHISIARPPKGWVEQLREALPNAKVETR